MKRTFTTLGITVCFLLSAVTARSGDGTNDEVKSVDVHWAVAIPLRDGVSLSATMYLPSQQTSPSPCIVTLTPYVADTYHERGMYFASHGLPFGIVDVRGRGNSQGSFQPFIQEANDGYDVVEWLARQPYCNGKVGMWGGSYAGYDQWAAAKTFPQHLATIVPVAAPYIGLDFPMRNNIFYPYDMQWLTYTGGHTRQAEIFGDEGLWSRFYRQWHVSGKPFSEVDTLLGSPSAVFQEWIHHPEQGAYWDAYNPTDQDYARLKLPILTITGDYDDDQPGAIEYYRRYMRNAAPEARARHYLIIGPWDHWGTRTPKTDVGGLKFGPTSLLDIPKLHLQWYGWTIGNEPRPEFLKAHVAYYVVGAERWRYAETLDSVTARVEAFFLDSAGEASDVFASGAMRMDRPGNGRPDFYRYDPREVNGPEVDAETRTTGGTLTDQSVPIALRGKSLVYHSPPFERDTELSGFFKFTAWLAIDCPDTDFYVSVYEIALDGSSVQLSTDALRARYREGSRVPSLIRTRAPLRYDFDHFTFISRDVKRGSRLRLVIAPMGRLVETTFAERNFNGGGTVASESIADARPVTVRLYHDRAHPSALYVPLGTEILPDEPSAPPSAWASPP